MFEKNLHIAYLLDFYGDVLQDKVRRVMESYYNEDLSLAEIAVGEEISRQGVRHLIKKGEEQLFLLEEQLGLASHYTSLSQWADELERHAISVAEIEDPRVRALVQCAMVCVKQMRNS